MEYTWGDVKAFKATVLRVKSSYHLNIVVKRGYSSRLAAIEVCAVLDNSLGNDAILEDKHRLGERGTRKFQALQLDVRRFVRTTRGALDMLEGRRREPRKRKAQVARLIIERWASGPKLND